MKYFVLLSLIGFFSVSLTFDGREPYDIMMMASGEYVMGDDTTAFSFIHDQDWFSLEEDTITGTFYFEKAKVWIDVGYNDCLMDTTTVFNASSDLVFCGNSLSEEELVGYPLPNRSFVIPIGTQHSFMFNGKQYILRAEGTIIEGVEEFEYSWDHIKDYKLYISDGKVGHLFFVQESFHDTRSEILFIGDIDKDGFPDVLLDNPRDYETYSRVLFLSTHALEDELVGNATSTGYDFSC